MICLYNTRRLFMDFQGNTEELIQILEKLNSTFAFNSDYNFKISIDVFKNNSQLIALSKEELKPIEFTPKTSTNVDIDSIIFVDKYTFELLSQSAHPSTPITTSFSETSTEKIETDIRKTKAKIADTDAKKSITDNNTGLSKQLPSVIDRTNTIEEHSNSLIETHDYDCVKVNRPAVFAIKKIEDNYYLLFYRKSVYDSATDTAFRKYLNEQPGILSVYKYIHSIDNLRAELLTHGIRLRHNGKNELSAYHVNQLISAFTSMTFL